MNDRDGGTAAAHTICARCVRPPRDSDDLISWVTLDDDEICPGCLTTNDNERLRNDSR